MPEPRETPRIAELPADAPPAVPRESAAPPSIDVRGLNYTYPGGSERALSEVSFGVHPGEIVGLVGPSGAGKSTLLMHLNGLLPERAPQCAAEAAVHVENLPVCREHLPDIRRLVGLLFQDPDDQLFCPTVAEDVAFGPLNLNLPNDEVRSRIAESLQAVGLDGYEDRSTLRLSVGERKRVCLAGLLACRPRVLALDEPFSNLDPRARRSLVSILANFDGCQIIATHDLDLVVELCSRVIVLDGGMIRADGPTRTILSNGRLMEAHGLEVPLRLRLPAAESDGSNADVSTPPRKSLRA